MKATGLFLGLWIASRSLLGAPADYFEIAVMDDASGRGVPLVELETVNHISRWTDSHGVIAFREPGLMGQEVFFFHVRSHGYEYPADFFKQRGLKLRPVAGDRAVIKLKRLNIAERLYRVTGEGIYRDSVLLGHGAPTQQPLLNGQVFGQDTVIATPYRGKIFWGWGDTDRASYPLGNFGASGATSQLPGRGGLDPGVGVDLTYFTNSAGFSRPMCPDASFGFGLKWIEGLMTLRDASGHEQLLARVAAGTGLERTRAWHLARFNDATEAFESLVQWDLHNTHDSAHPFRVRVGETEYFHLYPGYRVKADLQSLTNLAAYEAFSCLAPGTRYAGGASQADRAPDGRVRYGWRAGADRLDASRLRELMKAGVLQPGEAWLQLRDLETARAVGFDRGSVCWNEYRRRWVWIGSGQAGEIWFSEADTPLGPWVYARRIVVHDHYNFYNPTQHPFFDEDGGRLIYFEGTYTDSFSSAKTKTPRYNYNQIMYRLALDDPRLDLPAPVYRVKAPGGRERLLMRAGVEAAQTWPNVQEVAFFAMPPERRSKDLVPVFVDDQRGVLGLEPSANGTNALFFAWPAEPGAGEPPDEARVSLSEIRAAGGEISYVTSPMAKDRSVEPSARLICWVWKNPLTILPLDATAHPVK